jgi:hypothetical protein
LTTDIALPGRRVSTERPPGSSRSAASKALESTTSGLATALAALVPDPLLLLRSAAALLQEFLDRIRSLGAFVGFWGWIAITG